MLTLSITIWNKGRHAMVFMKQARNAVVPRLSELNWGYFLQIKNFPIFQILVYKYNTSKSARFQWQGTCNTFSFLNLIVLKRIKEIISRSSLPILQILI